MSIKKFLFTGITTCLIASSTIPIFASAPQVDLNNPLSISFVLDQLEDKLEKAYEEIKTIATETVRNSGVRVTEFQKAN